MPRAILMQGYGNMDQAFSCISRKDVLFYLTLGDMGILF